MSETPYKLTRLKKKLETMNGTPPTAVESRTLTVLVADALVEVWQEVLDIKEHNIAGHYKGTPIDERKKDSDWGKTAALWFADRVLPVLISTAILGLVAWWLAADKIISKL